ncbi:hypothetical protein LZ31DRAFT_357460 [Colletotrichum somersetense]|nr:hypothetical protein LZ31DRAFT_357460 [Colletotrichum somersetense]
MRKGRRHRAPPPPPPRKGDKRRLVSSTPSNSRVVGTRNGGVRKSGEGVDKSRISKPQGERTNPAPPAFHRGNGSYLHIGRKPPPQFFRRKENTGGGGDDSAVLLCVCGVSTNPVDEDPSQERSPKKRSRPEGMKMPPEDLRHCDTATLQRAHACARAWFTAIFLFYFVLCHLVFFYSTIPSLSPFPQAHLPPPPPVAIPLFTT